MHVIWWGQDSLVILEVKFGIHCFLCEALQAETKYPKFKVINTRSDGNIYSDYAICKR